MKKHTYIPGGIYKARVLDARILPDRSIQANEIRYGFNCVVAAYSMDGELAGEAEGGGIHNDPLTHNSPAVRFFRALQDIEIEKVCDLNCSEGACLLVEIETKIIPSLGVRNVITRFISREEMSLAEWECEAERMNDSGKCRSRL